MVTDFIVHSSTVWNSRYSLLFYICFVTRTFITFIVEMIPAFGKNATFVSNYIFSICIICVLLFIFKF